MSVLVETVDAEGNIGFGQGEDVDVRIIEYDGASNVTDLSVQDRYITLYGSYTLKKPLVTDPDNATGKRILITFPELDQVVYSSCKFTVTDETSGSPIILWEGFVYRR